MKTIISYLFIAFLLVASSSTISNQQEANKAASVQPADKSSRLQNADQTKASGNKLALSAAVKNMARH